MRQTDGFGHPCAYAASILGRMSVFDRTALLRSDCICDPTMDVCTPTVKYTLVARPDDALKLWMVMAVFVVPRATARSTANADLNTVDRLISKLMKDRYSSKHKYNNTYNPDLRVPSCK